VCVRTRFRTVWWNQAQENAAPEGRPNLAQRFSAGKSGRVDSSPGGTTEFSRTPRKRQTNELKYLFFITLSQTIIFQEPYRTVWCNQAQKNPAPEGSLLIAQRFSAGKSRRVDSSPGGTTEFSRTPRKRQTNELKYLFFNTLSQTSPSRTSRTSSLIYRKH
jgi:hypothetical protein